MCGPDSFSLPKSRARALARPSTHPFPRVHASRARDEHTRPRRAPPGSLMHTVERGHDL